MARVVRPGGSVASLEFLVPAKPFWQTAWWCYTRLVLPPAGWLTGGREWWRVGRFLGPNISGHYRRYPVDWTVAAWEKAGLENVGVRENEPRRRTRHVGSQGAMAERHAANGGDHRQTVHDDAPAAHGLGPLTTPLGPAASTTGGPFCTRPTRCGTSRT